MPPMPRIKTSDTQVGREIATTCGVRTRARMTELRKCGVGRRRFPSMKGDLSVAVPTPQRFSLNFSHTLFN